MSISSLRRDLSLSAAWLAGLYLLNLSLDEPIRFILFYALPVILLTWKYSFSWGLLAVACSLGAAMASGAIQNLSDPPPYLIKEKYYALLQLLVISLSVEFIKFPRKNKQRQE